MMTVVFTSCDAFLGNHIPVGRKMSKMLRITLLIPNLLQP